MSSLSTLSMNCPSAVARCSPDRQMVLSRSEEHTSELQSHSDLVCRLLLEKKKKKKQQIMIQRHHLANPAKDHRTIIDHLSRNTDRKDSPRYNCTRSDSIGAIRTTYYDDES